MLYKTTDWWTITLNFYVLQNYILERCIIVSQPVVDANVNALQRSVVCQNITYRGKSLINKLKYLTAV